jgi:hypothetical protein
MQHPAKHTNKSVAGPAVSRYFAGQPCAAAAPDQPPFLFSCAGEVGGTTAAKKRHGEHTTNG